MGGHYVFFHDHLSNKHSMRLLSLQTKSIMNHYLIIFKVPDGAKRDIWSGQWIEQQLRVICSTNLVWSPSSFMIYFPWGYISDDGKGIIWLPLLWCWVDPKEVLMDIIVDGLLGPSTDGSLEIEASSLCLFIFINIFVLSYILIPTIFTHIWSLHKFSSWGCVCIRLFQNCLTWLEWTIMDTMI